MHRASRVEALAVRQTDFIEGLTQTIS